MNLNQVTLPVRDMKSATEFYRKLGFTQIVQSEVWGSGFGSYGLPPPFDVLQRFALNPAWKHIRVSVEAGQGGEHSLAGIRQGNDLRFLRFLGSKDGNPGLLVYVRPPEVQHVSLPQASEQEE